MSKAEVVFKKELEYISSKGIKDFVLKCFEELTPDYFWDFTASSSQLHHPRVSNKKHGLVLHTKLCVWWGRKLADSFNFKNIDVIVASLLLHDLQKFGKILDKNNKPTLAEYASSHGPMISMQMEKLYVPSKIKKDLWRDINTITTCIALHMGRWTDETLSLSWSQSETRDKDNVPINIVHLADYCASRKVDDELEKLDNYKFTEE